MINTTLNDILNNNDIFRQVYQSPMPARTAFKIARLIRELEKENTTFNESRDKILEKYAMRDDNGAMMQEDNQVMISPDRTEDFQKEIDSLLKTSVEINADKLTLDDLADVSLSPKQIIDLGNFLEE